MPVRLQQRQVMALQFISCSRLSMEGEMLTSVLVSKPVQEFQAKQDSMREAAYWRSCFPVVPVCFSLHFDDEIEWSRSSVLKQEFNKHFNETCAEDFPRAPSHTSDILLTVFEFTGTSMWQLCLSTRRSTKQAFVRSASREFFPNSFKLEGVSCSNHLSHP